MLMYTHLLSNGTSVPHGTHVVDMPGCNCMLFLSAMIIAYYMVRYSIDVPG